MPPKRTVLVTGISGNLGTRLLPLLSDFRVVGVDLRPPETPFVPPNATPAPGGNPGTVPICFEEMDLGREACCRRLIELLRQTGAQSVIHLAFVLDPQRTGVLDVERMWQINVAGTARVMEAVSVVNRTGGGVQRFIFPSSVAAYGPDTVSPVKEDAPLRAHTLPYAIHKRESDEVVRYRAESLGDCRTYILRPHIFAGASMQNYIVGALRGTPLGASKRAARMRAQGRRLPLMLPRGEQYLEKRFQFLHVDDMARLLTLLLYRPATDPPITILNVAGRGEPLTLRRCAEIAQATIKRVPTRASMRSVLRLLWKLRISSIPPDAMPYLIGSYTMDTSRLQQFLGADYPRVIQYTVEDALRDCFNSKE
ncbi:MAG TPA: NAD-dependent epimerase/dehydratase family protein [Terriglobales bacterium]|nr:NAD-dependent epimerase/dehydratase family protein [Terriglobales bacterium]